MIKAIVCVDKKWSIGKDNDLLFKLPQDMHQFKLLTEEEIVVCGYNTLLSFPGGKALKNRATICLCPEGVDRDDCFCVHDFKECVKLVQELSKVYTVWVIGGAMMYKSFLPYCQEAFVTKVNEDGQGTVFFPNLDEDPEFELLWTSEPVQDGTYTLTFNLYSKRA